MIGGIGGIGGLIGITQVDVPNQMLRFPNKGEWKVELLNDLSDDIAVRSR